MIGSRLALLPLLLLPAAPARAQDAREALIRSIEQESQVSFVGRQTTDVTDRDKTRHAEQVVQRLAPDKLRIEYVAPARLKGELVVDDGQRLRRYIPSLRVVEEGPSQVRRSRQRQLKRIQALRAGKVTVALVGPAMQLGRPVTIVSVMPTKPDHPVRRLWLDRETGVALRVEDQFPGGRTSVTSFVQINFHPILGPAEFQLPIPRGFTVVPESMGKPISVQRARQIAHRLWGGIPQPTQLPPGFALTSAHQLSFHKLPVIALRYTRGREDLSLFVSASADKPFSVPKQPRVQPAVNVSQRSIGRVLVTLVGSLPAAELERIADSLRLPNEPGSIPPPVDSRPPTR